MALDTRVYYALVCDGCRRTLADDDIEVHRWDDGELIAEATAHDWTVADGKHFCPDCAEGRVTDGD